LAEFCIATAVTTLTSFRSAPHKGHLERVQRICSYLSRMKHGMIRANQIFQTYLTFNLIGKHQFMVMYMRTSRRKFQQPPGNVVKLSHYVDANLYIGLFFCNWDTSIGQPDSHLMVLQETSNCGNCNIWIKVCSS